MRKHSAEVSRCLDEARRAGLAGAWEEAEHWAKVAAKSAPRDPMPLLLLGDIAAANRNIPLAIKYYRESIRRQPDLVSAHGNLGLAYMRQGDLVKAEQCFERVLRLNPEEAIAWLNLGNLAQTQGNIDKAKNCYKKVLLHDKHCCEAMNNLAVMSIHTSSDEAIALLREALVLQPTYIEARINLGNALRESGNLLEAIDAYRTATEQAPFHGGAWNNLGNALIDQGNYGQGYAALLKAVQLQPEYAEAHSNLLFAQNFSRNVTAETRYATAQAYGVMVSRLAKKPFDTWKMNEPNQRLRVGFVSGDLHQHPVAYFLEGILSEMDEDRFELHAYPTGFQCDSMTERLREKFSAWHPISGMNDAVAAQMIHAQGIHILVDLSGHTAQNRLPLFAWKPAPIQLSWLGYFATTGLAQMDYLIADDFGVPDASREQFSEQVWKMPETRLCFTPPQDAQRISDLPSRSRGYTTFGCFQNLAKIQDEVLLVWYAILKELPSAELLIANKAFDDLEVQRSFTDRLKRFGFEMQRIRMRGGLSRTEYLASYADVDIMLDTFPYPGGATTCEALWMGVPTVTLAGDTLLERQGLSLLSAAGLPEWVAVDQSEYVLKAVNFSKDSLGLAQLRMGLRQQVMNSDLFDVKRFAANFERALRQMWERRQGADL